MKRNFTLTLGFLFFTIVYSPLHAQLISTVAGNGAQGYNGDNIPATAAELFYPSDLAIDNGGNLYFIEQPLSRVRRVDAISGIITTVAGNGSPGYNGDGIPAKNAELNYPECVAVDSTGNVYIADAFNQRIRRVDAISGIISTVAGNDTAGYNGDSVLATEAQLNYPDGVVIDRSGNIYIAEGFGNRIRKVDAISGIISTVAGNGTGGYNGDGIAATEAQLKNPSYVTLDAAGNIYIDDLNNNRIREVNSASGIISTVAGNGTQGYNGDGIAATSAEFYLAWSFALDDSGNLYIADQVNHRVRKVDATSGIISTVAGTGINGYNGDGIAATSAELYNPVGVAINGNGDIYIGDQDNNRVRKVAGNNIQLRVAITASHTSVCPGMPVTFTASLTNGGTSPTYQWQVNGINAGADSSTYTTDSLPNNAVVSCIATSSLSGVTGSPDTSNKITITVNNVIAAIISAAKDSLCFGDTANLSVGPGPGSIQWQSSPDNLNYGNIGGATGTTYLTPVTQTTYYRVYVSNNNCSDSSASLKIVVNPLPVPMVGTGDSVICSGDSTHICATASFVSYVWNTGSSDKCTYANVAGGYWVTVTDTNGCTGVSTHQNISVYPVPSVSIVVQGDTLSTFGAVAYQWYLNDSAINGATQPVYIARKDGGYSIEITDTNGCHATSTPVPVFITGIQQPEASTAFNIFPNPAFDKTELLVDEKILGSEYQLFEVSGKLLISAIIRNEKTDLDLAGFSPGIYLIKVGDSIKKLVLQ